MEQQSTRPRIYTQEYFQSRKAFVKGFIGSGLTSAIGVPIMFFWVVPGLVVSTIGLAWMFQTHRKCKWHSVEVAKNKVSVHRGLFARHSYGIYYDDIVDIKVKQTLYQRIMGYGSLYVNNPSHDHHKFCAYNMPNPHAIAKHIERMERNYTHIRQKEEEFD